MPNPIQCTLDPSQAIPTFDCEPVEISSSTTALANQSLAEPNRCLPDTQDAPSPDAVRSLVKNASPQLVSIPPAHVPLASFLAEGLTNCPSQTLDIGLAVAAAASGGVPVAILAGAKVGVDLGQCLAPQYSKKQDDLTSRAAEDYCAADGGNPRLWVGNRLQCVYPAEAAK
jgi:hypothetical protein